MIDKKIIIFFDSKDTEEINNFTFFFKNIDLKKYQVDVLMPDTIKIKVSKKINLIRFNNKNKLHKLFLKYSLRLKLFNKYDAAIIYTMNSLLGNFSLKKASKNKIIIVENIYLNNITKEEYRKYFMKRNIYDFEHIIFKNYQEQECFLKLYPSLLKKTIVINGLINYEKIEKMSNDSILEKIKRTDTNLLLISELNEEKSKLLTKFSTIKKLKKDIPNIKLYIIGDGIDRYAYETYIEDNNLTDTIYLLGDKPNPYPYIKKCKYMLIFNDKFYKDYVMSSLLLKTQVISTINIPDDITNNKDFVFNISNENYETELKDILIKKEKKSIKIDFDKCNEEKVRKIEKML